MSARTTLILLTVLLVVGVPTYWFLFGRSQPESPKMLGGLSQEEIVSVDILHGEESIGFEKTAPREWKMVRPKEEVVDSDIVEGVTIIIEEMAEGEKLAQPSEDKAQYGLAPPEFRIEIGLASGEKEVLQVGYLTPTSQAYYTMREGDPNIYLVGRLWGESLLVLFRAPPTDTPTPTPTAPPTPTTTPTPYEFY